MIAENPAPVKGESIRLIPWYSSTGQRNLIIPAEQVPLPKSITDNRIYWRRPGRPVKVLEASQ